MYDIKPLEEEWKKYQHKKRKPFYFIISLLAILCIMVIFYNSSNMNLNFLHKHINNISLGKLSEVSNEREKNILLNDSLTRLEVKDIFSNSSTKVNLDSDILVDIPILEEEIKVPNISRGKVHLDIIETSSVKAYEDVEKRFLQSHDIDDAFFLAKSYYKKQNYTKAAHWALETNKIDDNLEESLFIFVKSKIKLGKKSEALSLLRSYIKRTDSNNAKKLLLQYDIN